MMGRPKHNGGWHSLGCFFRRKRIKTFPTTLTARVLEPSCNLSFGSSPSDADVRFSQRPYWSAITSKRPLRSFRRRLADENFAPANSISLFAFAPIRHYRRDLVLHMSSGDLDHQGHVGGYERLLSLRQFDHISDSVVRKDMFDQQLRRAIPGRQGTQLLERRIEFIVGE